MTEGPDVGDGVEVARITIVKTFDTVAEGGMAVHVLWSGDLSLVDALGMLSFAEMTTVREYLNAP